VIAPTHAGAADRNALRRARLQQQLAALQEEEATSGDAEDEEALRALYAQRFGEDQLEALVDQYRLSRREDADTERVRTLPAELRSRLLADIEIGDEALTELARARADSVREQLVAAGLDAGRIRIEDDIRIADGRERRLTMAFELAPDASGS